MTLLELRLSQRRKQLDTLYEDVERLKRCDRGGYSDVTMHILMIEETVRDLGQLTRRVEDLKDIQNYGPDGGRGPTSATKAEP